MGDVFRGVLTQFLYMISHFYNRLPDVGLDLLQHLIRQSFSMFID